MSADAPFQCPVCRASQTLRDTCRRCKADLSLVVRAHRRLAYVNREIDEAFSRGDLAREEAFSREQLWLAPARDR